PYAARAFLPSPEEMAMNEPPSRMRGPASRNRWKTPSRLMPRVLRQTSTASGSSSRDWVQTPADAMTRSTGASPMASARTSGSLASPGWRTTRPGPLSRSAASLRRPGSRATAITSAPSTSRSCMPASPMPLEAPVIRARRVMASSVAGAQCFAQDLMGDWHAILSCYVMQASRTGDQRESGAFDEVALVVAHHLDDSIQLDVLRDGGGQLEAFEHTLVQGDRP